MIESEELRQQQIENMEKIIKDLVAKFKCVLESEQTKESEIQMFLEEHSELIPLPILEGHQHLYVLYLICLCTLKIFIGIK